MTKYPNSKFEQWLLTNHERTIESLTWQEYNKYNIMYNTERQLYVLLNCSRFIGCFTRQQIIMTMIQLQSEFDKNNRNTL